MSLSQCARRIALLSQKQCLHGTPPIGQLTYLRQYSSEVNKDSQKSLNEPKKSPAKNSDDIQPKRKKTQAELDKELELKMQGLSGDGGEAGVEFEDGQPVAMKRSITNFGTTSRPWQDTLPLRRELHVALALDCLLEARELILDDLTRRSSSPEVYVPRHLKASLARLQYFGILGRKPWYQKLSVPEHWDRH